MCKPSLLLPLMFVSSHEIDNFVCRVIMKCLDKRVIFIYDKNIQNRTSHIVYQFQNLYMIMLNLLANDTSLRLFEKQNQN